VHTGYREGSGGVVHPTFGSVVSATIGDPEPELPNFVAVNGGDPLGSGFLGPNHMPLFVPDAAKGVENLKASEGFLAFDRRFTLLDEMEQGFLDRKKSNAALAHKTAYDAAHKLMHSAKAKAFDLSAEPASVRSAYGSDKFGEGCLLARRLVEAGVPFVEVNLANWDTHRDNFPRVKSLSTVLDQGMSALLADLKSRGMLDDTLVICMGEFGRTPHLTGNGRGHWPRAWSSVLAGGGIKSGQVIGRTDKTGGDVDDGKVAVIDFLATICKVLEIDWTQNFHTREGRPIRVVDKGEKLIPQLLT
jgi:hypothetical protein